jgi:hypothetical protein
LASEALKLLPVLVGMDWALELTQQKTSEAIKKIRISKCFGVLNRLPFCTIQVTHLLAEKGVGKCYS